MTTTETKPGRSRAEASEYLWERWRLRYAPATLAHLAVKQQGPVYTLRGRFADYQDEALDTFARSKIKRPKRKALDNPHKIGVSVRRA